MSDDFEKIFKKRLDRRIKKAEAEAAQDIFATIPDSTILFKAKRKAVRFFLRGLEQDFLRFKADCFNTYQKELRPDTDRFPLGWMENQVKIMANMERKGNRLFFPLINALCKIALDKKKSEKVMREINIQPMEVVTMNKKTKDETIRKRPYVLLPPLTNNIIVGLAESLGVSVDPVYRTIREMTRRGIIKKVGRVGKGGGRLYAVGLWTPFKEGKFRAAYFLKNSPEMRQALREFNAYERKRFASNKLY